MNMENFFALETYVASRKLNLGDGESVLSLLYHYGADKIAYTGCFLV